MRVLLVHCFYRSSAPSGEDSVYRNEKKLLEDNGFEVITYEKYNDNLDNHSTLNKISAGAEFIWSSLVFHELTKIIEKYKPDVAHFHNIFPQISTSSYAACKKMGVPVVQTLHNYRYICPSGLLQRKNKPCEKCIKGSLLNSLIYQCYRGSLFSTLPIVIMIIFNKIVGNFNNKVDRYIALTNFSKSRFIAGGFPKDKFSVKPNFVDFIENSEPTIGDYVVFVGRLTQEKGVGTLIEACKKIKNIPVKILGDGELRGRLESICIQFNLNVEFLGNQPKDKVMAIIKKSRFLVIPSEWYEGFPVVVVEAYACGKPVLASKIGSLDEIIIENVTGRKFTFGSSSSLAATIESMWLDTKMLKVMANNARAVFDTQYNPTTNFKNLLQIYSDVINKK